VAKRSKQKPEDRPADRGKGRWLVARYHPVSLFSLRMTHATSKGGKTLLAPTPYSVKMALLDACFRRHEASEAEAAARSTFDTIKAREVRVRPPEQCVVQNTFIRVLDAERDGDLPFKRTIAYREFVAHDGVLDIALAAGGLSQEEIENIAHLFLHISSFGKRGSFWQFEKCDVIEGDLPAEFAVPLTEPEWRAGLSYGTVQMMDDFGDALIDAKNGFDRVSTYGEARMQLGEHRILVPTALPYRRISASRNFTWYSR
jgi:hypothetical protein